MQNSVSKIAILGTFPPRRCRIATFTSDLYNAISTARDGVRVEALAMSDREYDYPPEVAAEISVNDQMDYGIASDFINRKEFDVLSVQHEYGIFGGPAGKYLLNLVRAAKMPVVTTLHTVLRNPTPEQREVMEELLELSARVVVMSRTAVRLLSQVHGVNISKVDYIPHGIPKIPASAGVALREQIGCEGPILLTFGLLSPDKGIENVIRALPKLAAHHPGVKYLVVGATHPHVKSTAGEVYRQSLVDLAESLGVADHVEFDDQFVSLERLIEYLSATHFYITPYLNPMQITSGTLAYSLGAGKVVISTPYEYATEVLAEGRGIVVPFSDPEAIADAVIGSCASPIDQEKMIMEAARYGSQMYWDRVGNLYIDSFNKAVSDSACLPKLELKATSSGLPDTSLNHLEVLTDDTGIYQHATFSVPNREEGYCVDDNARALLLTVQMENRFPLDQKIQMLQSRYLSFVLDAFDRKEGRFRNFMNFQRQWLETVGSEDSQGRSMWAFGVTAGRSQSISHSMLSAKIFDLAVPSLLSARSPRTWAYAILGATAYLERFPDSLPPRTLLEKLAGKLDQAFSAYSSPKWPWPEARLAYANARLPQALILAGKAFENQEMTDRGLRSLAWLMDHQVSRQGCFSPVGTDGAGPEEFGKTQFDQQPIEAWSSVSACCTAFEVTGHSRYLDSANWCFEWFLGRNIHSTPLANIRNGSCYDGLLPDCVNQNQGAESTLSYLCALTELKSAVSSDLGVARNRGMI